MIILGLSSLAPSGVVHDATASLVIDGKIRSSVSEDRFSGVKHHEGYPSHAIKFCLQREGLRLSDVDRVVVGYGLLPDQMNLSTIKNFSSYAKPLNSFSESPIRKKNPLFYNHEYIHARTGYFFSGFKKALVISIDGGGTDDGRIISGGIFIIDEGSTQILRTYPLPASLGWTYGGFTEACGFRMIDGEGKTMSFAAFGENESIEKKDLVYSQTSKIFPKYKGIDYMGGGIESPSWHVEHNSSFARFDDPRLINLTSSYSKELIAWAAQKVLEDTLVEIISSAVENTGIKNVILTGGVFYNMIANMVIRSELEKKSCSIFINPVCGDLGNAVGCAIEEYYQQTGKYAGFEWPNLSLGPEYDKNEILSSLNKMNFSYSKIDKISTTVDLIDKGKVVGWFQGRAELGPRGLGNRSILSRVDDVKFKDIINNKVKHRESWRPFCPTMTKEKSHYYLENYTYAPYMILGFHMKHPEEAPAVQHIDNTTRPQTLDKTYNEEFYEVVNQMGGIVLNTSLNLAGDPINISPTDALLSFKHSQMDALIIGDYLVQR